jgi:hypothetical protein
MTHPERADDSREPDPRPPISEHTVSGAQPETIPAESEGGPPRRDDLAMTTDEMARRALEQATEAQAPER